MSGLAGAGALLKAADRAAQEAEGERPEAWMAPIEGRVALIGGDARGCLADDAPRLFGDLAKAAGGAISAGQIADLKLLVRQHYLCRLAPDARAAFWAVPEATKARWRALGIAGPAAGQYALSIEEQIDDAVVAARVAEILDTGASYQAMRRLAAERPLTRVQELARQIAREHAGRTIDFLADRHAHALAEVAATHQLRQFRDIMYHFLGGAIPGVGSERRLARHLRETLGGAPFERDWLRVAVSETRWAFNYATFAHYHEQGREHVYFVVQPNACAHCKKLLLEADGVTPRVFDLGTILEDIALTGGTNAGRSAALIGRPGGWLVTALTHPWCRCYPRPWVAGLPPVPVGDLRRRPGVAR